MHYRAFVGIALTTPKSSSNVALADDRVESVARFKLYAKVQLGLHICSAVIFGGMRLFNVKASEVIRCGQLENHTPSQRKLSVFLFVDDFVFCMHTAFIIIVFVHCLPFFRFHFSAVDLFVKRSNAYFDSFSNAAKFSRFSNNLKFVVISFKPILSICYTFRHLRRKNRFW